MALVSPGIQISVNDQSQYVNSNVGSVPLVVLATAQDKTYNGQMATGTTKANAGKLMSFTSQRDLVTAMGTPTFQLSAAGTPLHGNELNEYGLLAAYSALGLTNQLYAIRADIDLNQLTGTSNRPIGMPIDGQYWLDTANSEFGLYELATNATTLAQGFSHIDPLEITDSKQVSNDNAYAYAVPTPLASVGQVGSYALVLVNTDGTTATTIRLFYKATSTSVAGLSNSWVQVGSTAWQKTRPVATGTTASPTIPLGSILTFANYSPITTTSNTTVSGLATDINNAAIPGVFANVDSTGHLMLFVTSAAKSAGNSATADGKITITSFLSNTGANLLTATTGVGIAAGSYYCPYFFYGTYAQQPSGGWYSTDAQPRPNGSIWFKTTSTGQGFNLAYKQWNGSLEKWDALTVPLYTFQSDAIYGLDPSGGGINIPHGQVIATVGVTDTTANGIKLQAQLPQTVATGKGGQLASATAFTAGNSFNLVSTTPGDANTKTYTITLAGTGATDFVSAILAANIPYVTAQFNNADGPYGSISISHTAGGTINLTNVTGTPLTAAQFVTNKGSGFIVNTLLATPTVSISNWTQLLATTKIGNSAPYTSPDDGTMWYYSNLAEVDIMVNDNGWKGYTQVVSDARGFNLTNTDPAGVIVSAGSAPVLQSDGTQLVSGDLWLDSSDTVNYPALYRYNAITRAWTSINNTDSVSSNGIVFADARWDAGGTADVISGSLPTVASLLASNYTDLDAPDYRLYPRGALLFNTRRSGYNVKKFVSNYFNSTSFPNASLPAIKDTWVSASGLANDGSMNAGGNAQRSMIIHALRSAIDSNLTARELIYGFNLLTVPGYPEVTSNLVTLNNDRANTGFIIADTPMTLKPNAIDITSWVSNSTGKGLPKVTASDPYTAIYYPAGLTNDLAGNSVAVPASHAALRTFLYNDQVSYPWFSPAGANRGLVSNLNDVGYIDSATGSFVHNGVNQGLRDALQPLKINPIAQLPGTGIVIWGQQTRSADTTARGSVNVVRLENYLRTIFASISNGYLFEPNDQQTRTSIARQIEGALHDVLSKRGVYDFLVICDSSNNTQSTIANQQLYVDIAIEPMRDVEFIYIPIALYNPGEISTFQAAST
jgi:hypothetical protein